jgi:predicted amino acid racemase
MVNLEALAHNAWLVGLVLKKYGLAGLPVLKGVASHPVLTDEVMRAGFNRLGFAEIEEPFLFSPDHPTSREGRVLIQLASPSKATRVVEVFKRSFQSMPESLEAVAGAAVGLGLEHEVIIMVDLGDNREGLPPEDVGQLLDLALGLPGLKTVGFGVSLACLGNKLPTFSDLEKIAFLTDLFRDRGVEQPVVSLGGSVFWNFLSQIPSGLATEIRLGDPFLLGRDIYRDQPLAEGSFRTDVCFFSAEVVEVKATPVNGAISPPAGCVDASGGRRTRALCEMGRFHTSLSSASANLDHLSCERPGVVVVGLTAGYVAVDVTDCPVPVRVGDCLKFHPGYWAIAQAFRNPLVQLEIRGESRARQV